MTTGTSRAIVGGAVVILAAVGGFLYYSKRQGDYSAITDFALCQAAGFQVSAGNGGVQICTTPSGNVYVSSSTDTTAAPVTATSTASSTDPSAFKNKIQVTRPVSDQLVTSPLTIIGKAVGNWYFEASFPIELLDGNGKSLVIDQARAQGDWMTANFVPFSATLTFVKPDTATGTLILRNDNPSGDPGRSQEIHIPVRF
jgi:hypothetical protein